MRKILFFLLNLSMCGILYSQEANQYLFNRTPEMLKVEAPNAASFNKYIDNPISLYNGTPEINIPLYTLKDGAIEIPITLRYNTSGIKVNEEASWVGLGWNLNVGGVITRQAVGGIDRQPIRGRETFNADKNLKAIMDIYDPDHNRNPTDFITTPWSQTMREAFDWYLREPSMRLVLDEGRLSPDVFYFSYPGGAGKFIIDQRDNSLYIIDRESDIKIEPVMEQHCPAISITPDAKGIMHFRITLPDGVVHYYDYFSKVLTSSDADAKPLSETYVLVQTVYPNGQTIRYAYDSYAHYNFTYSEQIQSGDNRTARSLSSTDSSIGLPVDLQQSWGSRSLVDGIGREFVLTGISTDNYNVSFTHSSREDLPDVKKLDQIIISDGKKVIRDIRFEYNYFLSNVDNNGWTLSFRSDLLSQKSTPEQFIKRLKLLSVYTLTKQEKQVDKHSFFYETKNLPRKDSYAVDYWGYYNGRTGNHSYIPEAYNLMWNKTMDYDKIKNMPSQSGVSLPFAQRGYDFEYCTAGMLTGIQYPTGGYTNFVYEPNTFVDYIIPTAAQTQDNTINFKRQIRDNNSSETAPNVKVWSHTFDRDTYVTLSVRVYRGDNSWGSVSGHQAYISGSVSADMNMRAECQAMQADWDKYHINKGYSVSKVKEVLVKKGTVYFVVEFPDGLGNQTEYGKGGDITMDISFKVAIEDKMENEGAGVRIRELVVYDSPDRKQVLKRTSYEYINPATKKSSGILQKKLRFVNFYPQTIDVIGISHPTPCDFLRIDKVTYSSDKFEIGSDNYISTPYQSFADVGYTCVKETRQADGENTGYTLYYFHNEEPKTAEHSISLHDPLNGKMRKVEYYQQPERMIKSETYNYMAEIYHYYYGFTFHDRLNLFPNIFNGTLWTMLEMSETSESFFTRRCNYETVYSERKFNHRSVEGAYLYDRLALTLHPLNAYNVTLKQKTVMQDGVTIQEDYTYNPQTLQLVEKQQIFPDMYALVTTYTYPNDVNKTVYHEMTEKHILSPIVEEKFFKDGSLIACKLQEYKKDSKTSLLLPSKIHFSEISSNLPKDTSTFFEGEINKDIYPSDNVENCKHDQYGNPIHVVLNGTVNYIYLWGYRGQYPIAEISNASYEDVQRALNGKLPESLSSTTNPNFAELDSLREQLPKAHITTYKYEPGLGMTEKTSPAGHTTYYEYDELGRLIRTYVKEKDNANEQEQTLKIFDYHYREN